jgi:hypothetical protein
MIKLKRLFVQDTKTQPAVSYSPFGRMLQWLFGKFGIDLQMHHVFLQRCWKWTWFAGDVLANRGLQRIVDAGFNLLPIPEFLNNALGRSPIGTFLLASAIIALAFYGISRTIEAFTREEDDEYDFGYLDPFNQERVDQNEPETDSE